MRVFITILSVLIPILASMELNAQILQVIGEEVNSQFDDLHPCFSPNGDEIYFTRLNHPENYNSNANKGDVWLTKMEGKDWAPVKKLDWRFTNREENAIGHISHDGKRFYFQKAVKKGQKTIQGIFMAEFVNGNWGQAQKLNILYLKNKSEDQSFCMNVTESVIILSMESYKTEGVEDLYFSKRISANNWTEPKNLGKVINTQFEEFSPWLGPDQRSLFFSSNGHGGFGSKDIFVSFRLDETWENWTKPVNLGPEINSEGMELAFRKNPIQKDQFILVRAENSQGHSDLYQLVYPEDSLPKYVEPIVVNEDPQIQHSVENRIKVSVSNKENRKSIPYTLKTLNAKEELLESQVAKRFDTLLARPYEEDTIFLIVESKGYLPFEKRYIFSNTTIAIQLSEEIELDSLQSEKPIELETVLFYKGTPKLIESSYLQLDLVSKVLLDNSNLKIQIHGHTDIAGDPKMNLKLSEERAKSVKNYIVQKGIQEERLSTKGFGGNKPLSLERDQASKSKNRRVEFIIVE